MIAKIGLDCHGGGGLLQFVTDTVIAIGKEARR